MTDTTIERFTDSEYARLILGSALRFGAERTVERLAALDEEIGEALFGGNAEAIVRGLAVACIEAWTEFARDHGVTTTDVLKLVFLNWEKVDAELRAQPPE